MNPLVKQLAIAATVALIQVGAKWATEHVLEADNAGVRS